MILVAMPIVTEARDLSLLDNALTNFSSDHHLGYPPGATKPDEKAIIAMATAPRKS
jgi:hypothetical protein